MNIRSQICRDIRVHLAKIYGILFGGCSRAQGRVEAGFSSQQALRAHVDLHWFTIGCVVDRASVKKV